jgi:succinate-semialdehyde dehydrogenase/glutarate-semialdehyde dehydrogenase
VTGFQALRRSSYAQRAKWMNAAAGILDAEVDQVAAMMTTEMGKTLASAKG